MHQPGCIYNQKTALQNAYISGHQIASHSWSHPSNFGSLSAAELTTQMQKLEGALVSIIGKKPTYMRPPYLATGGSVQSTMQTLGYRIITDDVDSGDWNGYSVAQSQQQFTNAGASGNGHIPLMHETYQTTVTQLVPWLINWASQNNLKLVTVGESMPLVPCSAVNEEVLIVVSRVPWGCRRGLREWHPCFFADLLNAICERDRDRIWRMVTGFVILKYIFDEQNEFGFRLPQSHMC